MSCLVIGRNVKCNVKLITLCAESPLQNRASCKAPFKLWLLIVLVQTADDMGKFDELVEDHGVRILIDPGALMHVVGTKMDFTEDRLKYVLHSELLMKSLKYFASPLHASLFNPSTFTIMPEKT